ncbi:DUF892 family protein [Pseudomonas sp. LA21]|uniref:ferritin-like domain-containing protein n=1 Tax=Pseudomonas sp. LA21 TaxID=2893373 RepID=UPI001FB7DE81|nr:DUF892 family protein [Pseudomonas sp. LA21]MCJ1886973.1 DUF892 family protein [Pseudomonas sp. LA21]
MTSKRDNLRDWLRDAHAMEEQAEQMLKAQSGRLEHYPQLKSRIEQHLDETRSQQRLIEQCLKRMDSSPSTMKDMGARLLAFGQAVGGMTVSDEVVKGSMSGYVFEHMEIAAYTVLISAAQDVGDTQTEAVLREILAQEVAMADWLGEHLPEVTRAFLERDHADADEAKR